MTEDEALGHIKNALDATMAGLSEKVSVDSHLTDDGIIDSLDSMNFLFELETVLGKKLTAIDEQFNDFRVKKLVEIVREAQ